MRKLAEGTFQKLKEVVRDFKKNYVNYAQSRRTAKLTHSAQAVCVPRLQLGKARKKNVGKMYWKNKRKCKYQKLVIIKSFFSVLSSLPQGP